MEADYVWTITEFVFILKENPPELSGTGEYHNGRRLVDFCSLHFVCCTVTPSEIVHM